MSATILAFPIKKNTSPKAITQSKATSQKAAPVTVNFNHSLFLKSSWGNGEIRLFEINHDTQNVQMVFKHTKKIRILEYIVKNYDLDKTYIPFLE